MKSSLKLHTHWRKFLKTYSFLSLASTVMVSVSVSGLALLGLLSTSIAFPVLAISGAVLGGLGCVGRLIDQSLDDLERDERIYKDE